MHLEAVKLMFYSKQTKMEDPGWVLRAPVWTLTLDWAWTLYMPVPDELPRREIVITKTAFLAHTLYIHTHTHTHSTSSQLNKLNQLSYLRFPKLLKKRLIPTPSALVERAVYTHSTRLFSFTRYTSPELFILGTEFSWKLHSEVLIKIEWWLTGIAAESLLGWLTSDLKICAGSWKCQSRSVRSSVKSRERGFPAQPPNFLSCCSILLLHMQEHRWSDWFVQQELSVQSSRNGNQSLIQDHRWIHTSRTGGKDRGLENSRLVVKDDAKVHRGERTQKVLNTKREIRHARPRPPLLLCHPVRRAHGLNVGGLKAKVSALDSCAVSRSQRETQTQIIKIKKGRLLTTFNVYKYYSKPPNISRRRRRRWITNTQMHRPPTYRLSIETFRAARYKLSSAGISRPYRWTNSSSPSSSAQKPTTWGSFFFK